MRKFSPEYLRRTREGMWEGSRDALEPLSLGDRQRILDAGAGTGELARVLDADSPGSVVCLDVDPDLLEVAREETELETVVGDATRPPFADESFDLVVCQALLVNLPDPAAALRAFSELSTDRVAAIEPDNGDVGVDSTVEREVQLERRVREAYIAGIETDVSMGDRLASLFQEAGLTEIQTRRYYHRKLTEPPYDDQALSAATRKASGGAITQHERELRQSLSAAEYDRLRSEWREMGREVIEAMQDGTYRRAEVVPFDVVVGRVNEA